MVYTIYVSPKYIMAQHPEWAPAIDTLDMNTLNNTTCSICEIVLYVPSDDNDEPRPCEITTCHHRFHTECLRGWCDGPGGNSLVVCRCPTCQANFNFNTQVDNLTEAVTNRLAILNQPVAAALPPVVELPVAGIPPAVEQQVNPPMPPAPAQPLENIVAADADVIRICGEIATVSNRMLHNKNRLWEWANMMMTSYDNNLRNLQPQQRPFIPPPFMITGYDVTANSIIQQIKHYVKMAYNEQHRQRYNFQESINVLQTTITNLGAPYEAAAAADSQMRANSGFIQNPNPNVIQFLDKPNNVKLGAGNIGAIFGEIFALSRESAAGMLFIPDARQYCNLLLQLYRRIVVLFQENGMAGGKKRGKSRKSKKQRKIKNRKSNKRHSRIKK